MLAGLVTFALLLQGPALRSTAQLVVAPVTVTDAEGKPVHGLTKADFRLLDNGQPRDFDVELLEERVSLVLVVQTSQSAVAALQKLKEVDSLLAPLVAGERGSVAVVACGDRVRLHQAFTRAPELDSLQAWGKQATLLDGVDEALRLLSGRPRNHRRVVLLVSEPKDRGSEKKLNGVLKRAQALSVTIFALTFSTTATQFTSRDMPVSGADSVYGGVNPLAALAALGSLGKEDAAAALARETGGARWKFTRQKTLEEAIAKVGEEIHTQYLLAFQAAGPENEEYRALRVELPGRPGLQLRSRPGYWIQPPP